MNVSTNSVITENRYKICSNCGAGMDFCIRYMSKLYSYNIQVIDLVMHNCILINPDANYILNKLSKDSQSRVSCVCCGKNTTASSFKE